MNKANTPFRYDYVGSFLRPAGLKQARADFQNGKIGADELKFILRKHFHRLLCAAGGIRKGKGLAAGRPGADGISAAVQ